MNQVWAVMMVRDEEDIILYTLNQLVDEAVDGFVIANNRSTDSTQELLEQFKINTDLPVVLIEDNEVGYLQSRKMTNLAKVARDQGAEWIIPIDADECLYSHDEHVATILKTSEPHVLAYPVRLFNHLKTGLDFSSDPNPFTAMPYRRPEPLTLPKVICRYRDDMVIEMGNHGVLYSGLKPEYSESSFESRHFPYRSAAQMIRKTRNGAEAYAATNLPLHVGAHWRQHGGLLERYGDEKFGVEVFDQYYYFHSPTDEGLIYDPAPYLRWQK